MEGWKDADCELFVGAARAAPFALGLSGKKTLSARPVQFQGGMPLAGED